MGSPMSPPDLNVPASFTDIDGRQRHDLLLRGPGDRRRRRVRQLARSCRPRRGRATVHAARTPSCGELLPRQRGLGRRRSATGRARRSRTAPSIDHGGSVGPQAAGRTGARPSTSRSSAAATTAARARACSRRSWPCRCRTQPGCVTQREPRACSTARTGRSTQTITTTAVMAVRRLPDPRHRATTRRRHARAARRPRRRARRRGPLRRPRHDLPGVQLLGRQVALQRQLDRRRRPSPGTARAVKVSFDRPYEPAARRHRARLVHARRLRRPCRGWSARATTSPTTPSRTSSATAPRVRDHRIFISGAHDEYWSAAMRTALEQARDARHRTSSSPAPTRCTGRCGSSRARSSARAGPRAGRLQDRRRAAAPTRAASRPAPGATPPAPTSPRTRSPACMYVGQKNFDYFPLRVTRGAGPGPRLALHRPRHPGRRRDATVGTGARRLGVGRARRQRAGARRA